MLYYYNEQDVQAVGIPTVRPGRGKMPHIPNGYRLIAVCDRLVRKCCPDVTDPTDYAEFWGQYRRGSFVSMDLFLINANKMPLSQS